jgi:molybdopterin-containing oxidoreductase family iron-sulfur binding subunit
MNKPPMNELLANKLPTNWTNSSLENGMMTDSNQEQAAVQVVTSIAPATSQAMQQPVEKLTLKAVQAKLAGKTGRRFYKSLEELSATQEFNDLLGEEFPRQAGEWTDAVSRRGFLKVMGASFALAGLAGCTKQPDEPIYPYVKQPEDLVLGRPMYFATAHPFPTGAIPVLVKSDAFRPIKIEGNPDHPMSKGKSDATTQATLLDLYDPDRSHGVRYKGQASDFGRFQTALLAAAKASGSGSGAGQGIYFLSETITSPTLAGQWQAVQKAYPQAKLVQWDPVNQDSSRTASKAIFGSYTDAMYTLDDADVILSLDADFLGGIAFPGHLPMAAAYAERHRYEEGKTMNRLYVVESMPTVTGFKAEHRLALKPSEIATFAQALANGGGGSFSNPEAAKFLTGLQADLKASGGKCVVIPGEQAAPAVHVAAYKLNQSLGAVGKTVTYRDPIHPMPTEQMAEFKALVADMHAGKVQFLVMLGTNPIYNAPADFDFAAALDQVPVTAHLGTHVDETGSITTWHINKAHYLESWSDARTYDGQLTIIQPMIAPLYNGVTAHDVLQGLLDNPQMSAYDVVLANAKTSAKGDFASSWRKSLHDGWVTGSAPTGAAKTAGSGGESLPPTQAASAGGLEIAFKHDPSLFDGRYANVGWLQELPKQVTSLSWDNAALVSLNTQEKLGIAENDAIEIELNGRKVVAPILMVPGHPDDVVTVYLGHGRSMAGTVGSGVGFNAYTLRTSGAPLMASGAKITRGKGTYDLCVTKVHSIEHRGSYAQHDLEKYLDDKKGTYSLPGHEAEERGIIRYATVAEAKANPGFAHEGNVSGTEVNKVGYGPEGEDPTHEESLSGDSFTYNHTDKSTLKVQNAWAMAIDLNSCIGCNACIVSCYAENNIPVVGREQVKVGRNMQWIRIDTYFEGDLHAPKAHFQPMACQHCENAGCELVCPVGATIHTPEGLNTMVYNRCVGTRYCSNNCAYKVRRFNFLLYSDYDTESLKFMRNPDVSVRSRGVMEKCTYCIQRIEAVKIDADKENRAIEDGEIVTACQQACPTNAIVFGNQNDPKSKVARSKREERSYQVLADLNYKPRTTYTAGVINPNPELA